MMLPRLFIGIVFLFLRLKISFGQGNEVADCENYPQTGAGNTEPATQETLDKIGASLRNRALAKIGKKNTAAYKIQEDGSIAHVQSGGTLKPIVYDDRENSDWPKEHADVLNNFVYAERDSNSFSDQINRAYQHMLNVPQNPPTEYHSSRLWEQVIGIPLKMWPGLILSENKLQDPSLIVKLLDRFYLHTYYGPVWDMKCRYDKNAGGNFSPRVIEALAEVYLRRNLTLLTTFIDELKVRLTEELVDRIPFNGNGFIKDGCIHQHNMIIPEWHQNGTGLTHLKHIYNAGYGKEFLLHMATLAFVLHDTQYDLDDVTKNSLFDAFFECHQWLYRGKTADPATIGRFVDHGTRLTFQSAKDSFYTPMLELEAINFRSFEVARALHRYHYHRPKLTEYILSGNRNFFVSDMMAHQRQDFMATLRMTSLRTIRPETKPSRNEARMGYYMGDGSLALVVDQDLGTQNNELFRAYNWAKVPGVTCPFNENVPQVQISAKYLVHSYNDAKFVGGASDLDVGMAAMVYARPSVPIRAKKSYAFFDNVIAVMGSDIKRLPVAQGQEVETVITTLNQVPFDDSYSGGKGDVVEDTITTTELNHVWSSDLKTDKNRWLYHKSVAYVLLESDGELVGNVETQVDFITMDVFSAWIDHGKLDQGEVVSYSYLIYPYVNKTDAIAYSKNPTVSIQQLTSSIHDVCHSTSKNQGVTLFEPGCFSIKECLEMESTTAQICTDKAGIILVKLADDTNKCLTSTELPNPSTPNSILEVTLADPTHELGDMKITLDLDGNPHDNLVALPTGSYTGKSTVTCFIF